MQHWPEVVQDVSHCWDDGLCLCIKLGSFCHRRKQIYLIGATGENSKKALWCFLFVQKYTKPTTTRMHCATPDHYTLPLMGCMYCKLDGALRTGKLYVTDNTALHLKQYTKICFWKTFKERETTNWMVVRTWPSQPVFDLGFSASSFTAQKQYGGHFHLTDSQLQLNNRCNLLNLLLTVSQCISWWYWSSHFLYWLWFLTVQLLQIQTLCASKRWPTHRVCTRLNSTQLSETFNIISSIRKNSVLCCTQVAVSFHLLVFLYFTLLGSFDLQLFLEFV